MIDSLPKYRNVVTKILYGQEAHLMFKRDTMWIHVAGGPCSHLAEMVKVAKSLEPYAGDQEAVEGQGNEASESSLITIKEVDSSEGEIGHEGQKGQNGGVLSRPATSLADAKEKAGFLYVPSYVPPGFELFGHRAGLGIASLTHLSRDPRT